MGLSKPNIEKMENERDIEGLIKALKYKEDSSVREAAAEALCNVCDERAVEPLTEALLRDKAWVIRRYAAEALGNIGVSEVVAPLTAALNNDPYVCEITGWRIVRKAAEKALRKIEKTKSATTPLERLLTCQWSSTSPSQEITSLIETLRRYCNSLSDRDVSKCMDAIQNLSKTKDRVVAEVLCYTALVASDYKVRNSAAHALKTIADSEIIQILCEALHYDRQVNPLVGSDWTLPTHALNTLEIVQDTSARGAIADFLNDFRKTWSMKGDNIVTGTDMFTLGARLDNEKSICISGCRALAALGGSDAVAAIQAVLSDPYWSNYDEIRKELPKLIAEQNQLGIGTPEFKEQATLLGHTRWVSDCAVSPDGSFIVSASFDNTLKVWDARTGKERATLQGHTNWVQACAVSPDGSFIVSAGGGQFRKDTTLKVWDAKTFEERATLQGHNSEVFACAVSPDGSFIVSASDDKTLKVWDAKTGKERATLTGHIIAVSDCTVSPDGSFIVSTSLDKTLKVWDAQTFEERATLTGHRHFVFACAVSPDGSFIVSASYDKTLKVWDAKTGKERATLTGHTDSVSDCAVSPDGSFIISASADNTLKVWDAQTFEERATLQGHTDSVFACAVSPDGSFIVSASSDGTLKVWNADAGE